LPTLRVAVPASFGGAVTLISAFSVPSDHTIIDSVRVHRRVTTDMLISPSEESPRSSRSTRSTMAAASTAGACAAVVTARHVTARQTVTATRHERRLQASLTLPP
jgi:hypothetical protein